MNTNGRAIELFDNLMHNVLRPMRFDALPGFGFDDRGMERSGMRMDVSENDQAYVIKADLPGVKKEDVNVAVVGNRVSISGEYRDEKSAGENDGRKLWSERYVGRFERSIELPQAINDDAAEATYRDGILELRLPKKDAGGMKRLEIH